MLRVMPLPRREIFWIISIFRGPRSTLLHVSLQTKAQNINCTSSKMGYNSANFTATTGLFQIRLCELLIFYSNWAPKSNHAILPPLTLVHHVTFQAPRVDKLHKNMNLQYSSLHLPNHLFNQSTLQVQQSRPFTFATHIIDAFTVDSWAQEFELPVPPLPIVSPLDFPSKSNRPSLSTHPLPIP